MKFPTFIKTFSLIMAISGACLAGDSAFISMIGDCRYPTVASEGNNLYLAWLVVEGRAANIYFQKSLNEGRDWSSAQRVSNENGYGYPPSIAVNSGVVHLVWIDNSETIDGVIYYNRSLDGGVTWEKMYIVVNNANSARYPLIACKGSNVYLIWQDVENKIYVKTSHDQGRTWKSEILLGKVGKSSCYCFPPAISAKGNDITVAWTDFREDRNGLRVALYGIPIPKRKTSMVSSIVCRKSTDNGATWSKDQVLTTAKVRTEATDEIDNPIMLNDGSLSYLFWLDKRNVPLGEIFYSRFDPQTQKGQITGKNLYPVEKRSPKRPSVVFDKAGNLHFTWATFFVGKSIVSYGTIDPDGNMLKEKQDLTSDTERLHNPIITTTPSGLLHILWFDEPKDKDAWSRIFLKTSTDNGLTWSVWGSQTKELEQ
jgi:hypothetical protein